MSNYAVQYSVPLGVPWSPDTPSSGTVTKAVNTTAVNFFLKEAWASGHNYTIYDIASDGTNGNYMCIVTTSNDTTAPHSDTAVWVAWPFQVGGDIQVNANVLAQADGATMASKKQILLALDRIRKTILDDTSSTAVFQL